MQACDSCREGNIECNKSDQHDCNECMSSGKACEYSLAVFNGHNNPPSDHVIPILSAAHDIQVRLMVTDNRTRLPQSLFFQATQRGNPVLQHYQMQLMLLEQQNIQRKVDALELTGAWLQIRDNKVVADLRDGQTLSTFIQRGTTQRGRQNLPHTLGFWPPNLRAISPEAGIPVGWRILTSD